MKFQKLRKSPDESALVPSSAVASAHAAVAAASRIENLPNIINGIRHGSAEIQTENVMLLRKLLSVERNPPIEQIVNTGIVPMLVQFLQHNGNPTIQVLVLCSQFRSISYFIFLFELL